MGGQLRSCPQAMVMSACDEDNRDWKEMRLNRVGWGAGMAALDNGRDCEALAGRLRPGGASLERFERSETGLKSVDCRNTGEVGTRVASYIVKL